MRTLNKHIFSNEITRGSPQVPEQYFVNHDQRDELSAARGIFLATALGGVGWAVILMLWSVLFR